MRKTFSHIVMLALTLCYVLSTMGYGVHHCDHDGTSNVVLCYGESPCEHCHEHEHDQAYGPDHGICDTDHDGSGRCQCNACKSGKCACDVCEYHHSSKCCHTRIFRISSEQVLQDGSQCPAAGVYLLACLPEQSFLNYSCSKVDFVCERIPAPPLISGNSINVINSQFLI
ncbi:MAG: hypothetical protein KBS89_01905 [Bacteroidales bacterium]|nr:hypothetical protein [Candidatus Egerieousia equi]